MEQRKLRRNAIHRTTYGPDSRDPLHTGQVAAYSGPASR